jgi:uncharacterized protein (TIGR02145 family)
MKNKIPPVPVLFSVYLIIVLAACNNDPPAGSFFLPLKSSCYLPGDEMMIKGSATDNDGSVTTVEIQLNGITIATLNTSEYEYTYVVDIMQEGECLLTGIATDDKGKTGSWEQSIVLLPDPQTYTDPRDGKVYRYVTIGTQEWMIDNLAWLPSVSPSSEVSDSEAIYYVSQYQGTDVSAAKATENYQVYGALYNWTAAQSCCPEGWHLPSDQEWLTMETYINSNKGIFDRTTYGWGYVWWGLGAHLWHTSGWKNNKNGINTYGFSALPGGGVYYPPLPEDCPGVTASCKCWADFWSATLNNGKGSARGLWSEWQGNMGIHRNYPKGFGISVRCVKDE